MKNGLMGTEKGIGSVVVVHDRRCMLGGGRDSL